MKQSIVTLTIVLLSYSNNLYASTDRGDTKIAANIIAGGLIFGAFALYRAIKNNKKS